MYQDFSDALRWPPSSASSSNSDLSMFAQRQASAGSRHMHTSQPLPNQFSPYIDQRYGDIPPEPPGGVSHFTDDGPWARGPPRGASRFTPYGPLPRRPPYEVSHFSDHGPFPPEPHRVSQFTDYGPLPPGPSDGVSHFSDDDSLEYGSPPGSPTENFYLASTEMTTSSELSNESLPRYYWTWKKCFVLLRLYTRYKSELSSSNINEQNVWRKIAEEVGKNNPLCDAKMCRNQIRNMKCEYERMKHKKPYELCQPEAVFLDEAENAFENTENSVFPVQSNLEKWGMSKPDRVKLLEVYEKYKELLLQSFDVEEQIVWGKVARELSKKCSSYYGKRQCCFMINNLKNSYEVTKRRNEMKKNKICKESYFFEAARKTFDSTECTGESDCNSNLDHLSLFSSASAVDRNVYEDFSDELRWPHSTASSSNSDSSMFAQRQVSAESRYMDTSQSLPNQFSSYIDQRYGDTPPEPPGGVSRFTDYGPWEREPPRGTSRFTPYGPLPRQPPRGTSRFTPYGPLPRQPPYEMSRFTDHGPFPPEPHRVSHFADYGPLAPGPSDEVSHFTDDDPLEHESPPGSPTENFNLASTEITNFTDSALPWKKRFALLRLYTIYKVELSSSGGMNEEAVFQKMASRYGNSQLGDPRKCRNIIHDMKREYERLKYKNIKPYELRYQWDAVFLDEAENAFENIENPAVFKVKADLQKINLTRQHRITLLKVYGKYKSKRLLNNFDYEEQFVWEKIAKEVSKKCSTFYGKRRCCCLISQFKSSYEKFKETNTVFKRGQFFDYARRTFGFMCRQASGGSSHTDSSQPLTNQFNPDIDQTDDFSPPGSPPGVSIVTDHGLLPPAPVQGVSQFTGDSEVCFDELSSSVSLPWKKKFILLRLYIIYKDELSSSKRMHQESAWQKISEKLGVSQCDAQECRNQIRILKCDYEIMKNTKPYECKLEEAVFMDEAENAFENNYNPVVFEVNERHLEKWIMWKPDRLKLLQIYIKFKKELLLQSFDDNKQDIWERFAVQVSKRCKNFYGKRRCCHLLNLYKKQLANHERRNKNGQKHKFFDQARITFLST